MLLKRTERYSGTDDIETQKTGMSILNFAGVSQWDSQKSALQTREGTYTQKQPDAKTRGNPSKLWATFIELKHQIDPPKENSAQILPAAGTSLSTGRRSSETSTVDRNRTLASYGKAPSSRPPRPNKMYHVIEDEMDSKLSRTSLARETARKRTIHTAVVFNSEVIDLDEGRTTEVVLLVGVCRVCVIAAKQEEDVLESQRRPTSFIPVEGCVSQGNRQKKTIGTCNDVWRTHAGEILLADARKVSDTREDVLESQRRSLNLTPRLSWKYCLYIRKSLRDDRKASATPEGVFESQREDRESLKSRSLRLI
ncbi:hypothetical protein C8R46DRAFT_1034880 [Mycena filopes]|nr:hypothetical protein C8R46DRAFT_1034880 [Mycena filopes]